jgi:NitT/TauT family transport system substrate-binding protein
MKLKKIFFLLIVTGILNLHAFSQNEKIKLAIGYIPHIQFAPLYAGIEKGFYSKYGIDLSIEYGFGIDIFSLIDAEKIDLGLSDSDQLIIAGSKNIKIGTIYQYYQKYPVAIVALDEKINSPSDFSGKTIGTPEVFGTSYIGLLEFLSKYNLNEKVKTEKIGYTQIQTLLSGKTDGVVCFMNNESIQLRLMGRKIKQWNLMDISDLPGASFISGVKQITKKKNILKNFILATREAMEWTVKNQSEAFKLSKKYLQGYNDTQKQFNVECLKETSKLFESVKGYGYIDPEMYKKSVNIMYDLKLIDNKFNSDNIIYNFYTP